MKSEKESRVIEETISTDLHARLWSPASSVADSSTTNRSAANDSATDSSAAESATIRGTLLLVHGLGDHGGRFREFARRVVASGWCVYAMDLPGHGQSGGRRGTAKSYDALMQMIASSREFLDARFPGVAQVLLGHSMGGNLAINYALRHREFESLSLERLAGVALVAPMLMPPQRMDRSTVFAAWGTGQLLRWLRISKPAQIEQLTNDSQMAAQINADPLQHSQISLYLATQLLAQGRFALDHAAEVELPTLVMHGDQDELIDQAACRNLVLRMQSRDSRGVLAESELVCWPGGLHDLLNDVDAPQVTECLVGWMERQTAARFRVIRAA